MKVEIIGASNGKQIAIFENLEPTLTIKCLKDEIHRKCPKYYPGRQSIRLEPRGKSIKDELKLSDLDLSEGNRLYFKDLGPQIGWSTVFLTEYAGPLFVYLMFVPRPEFIYGVSASLKPRASVVWIAAGCWSFHYIKRILETLFVHRFSKGTMPIRNLFKNSSYYWGFAAFVSYFINHPLYTPPAYGDLQVTIGLLGFLVNEYGNFASHCVLRDLRPKGSTVRKIPYPTSNPMTFMFNLVSCPNYTYEVFAWLFFTVMTQTLSAGLFTLAGFLQMTQWAQGKHRNYRREFKNFPKSRRHIGNNFEGLRLYILLLDEVNCYYWINVKLSNMTFMDILYWRDPKKTGPIFVACLLLLYSFHHFSVVTVITYLLKISLLPTLLFRLVISLKAALTKTECEHPFKDALELDIDSLVGMSDKSSLPKFVKIILQECRRILLVEDVVDTVKVLAIVHVVSYLGEWFSGITLLFLCLITLFTVPKFYDMYKHEIHNMIDKVSKIIEEVKTKVLAYIPTKSKSSVPKKSKGLKESKNVEEISPASEKRSPPSDDEQKEKIS